MKNVLNYLNIYSFGNKRNHAVRNAVCISLNSKFVGKGKHIDW